MKTKIIYISGNETFEASEIRAAFDEVRSTLGFEKDTILFGVPVDFDDAGLQKEKISAVTNLNLNTNTDSQETTESDKIKPDEFVKESVIQKDINNKTEIESEQMVEDNDSEKVIPILSVLSGKDKSEIKEDLNSNETTETQSITSEDTIQDTDVVNAEIITTKTVTIEEMMNDDVPVAETEKTLEELFASIKPLGEDASTEKNIQNSNEPSADEFETNTTLEQLANEFSESEDDIICTPKTESSGRIGKLKNILPFKKAKREESGLMGDLFGWAGIAANDEDFDIPGFFATSASKK